MPPRLLTGILLLTLAGAARAEADAPAEDVTFADVQTILEQYCYDCHGYGGEEGGVALDRLVEDWEAAAGDAKDERAQAPPWSRVLSLVRADVMPPADSEQPTEAEVHRLAEWIKQRPFGIDPEKPDPGRVTLRRLNRVEYRNTIRDLMGIEYDTHLDFPADGSGHGFDNVADVLTVSPLLFEKYVAAAREIVGRAVPGARRVVAEERFAGGRFVREGHTPHDDWQSLSYYEPTVVSSQRSVEHGGRYELVVRYRADEEYVDGVFDQNRCRLRFFVDGQTIHDAEYTRQGGREYELRHEFDWSPGEHDLRFELEPVEPAAERVRDLKINLVSVTVRGPLEKQHWVEPEAYREWFPRDPPEDAAERREYARELLDSFATRAYRRPPSTATLDRLTSLVEAAIGDGKSFEEAVQRAMTGVLASPRFLFREEASAPLPAEGVDEPYPLIDEHSLASRLSYFLWSTMPDAELMRLAGEGRLRANLDEQFDRLLADEKSSEFVSNFVGQWLRSRDIQEANVSAFSVISRDKKPDPDARQRRRRYRELSQKEPEDRTEDEKEELQQMRREYLEGVQQVKEFELDWQLRRAMRRETEMLFDHVLRGDAGVLDLLDSDYTFLNERLAKHYGVEGVEGKRMRRVKLPEGSPRGGVLTQGTVLVTTSNPDRTSPVKRGLFVLENLIGTPPPPPPPDIPPLEDSEKDGESGKLTLRRSLELHRDSPLCASCHARMDPLGLALENFNALGLLRETDRGEPIDPTGTLVSGESFSNANELKRILVTERRQDFYRCLTEKIMTYALGRGVEYYDESTVDRLVERLEQSGGDLRGLIRGVVDSVPFQRRRRDPASPSTVTAERPHPRSRG